MFEKERRRVLKKLAQMFDEKLDEIKEKVDEYTPEDTYELIKHNERTRVRYDGRKFSWKVKNHNPYAIYVEYWHNGKIFNYYKWRGRKLWWLPFYRWIGAKMFSRTKKELAEKIVWDFQSIFKK